MDGTAARVLTIVPSAYADASDLVATLDHDLAVRYDDSTPVLADATQFLASARGAFFVALVDGVRAGCAGIRHETDDAAELKRMWVDPAFRGLGLARALLTRCEDASRALGYSELWLGTGTMQPEAVALYRSAGYVDVPGFGQWAGADLAIHLGKPL